MEIKFVQRLLIVICVFYATRTSHQQLLNLESILMSSIDSKDDHKHLQVTIYSDQPFDSGLIDLTNMTLTSTCFAFVSATNTADVILTPELEVSAVGFKFETEAGLLQILRKFFLENSTDESCTGSACGWPPYYFLIWPNIVQNETEIISVIQNKFLPEFSAHWTLDSDVFIIFKGEDGEGELWEVYSIKDLAIFQRLTAKKTNWFELIRKVDRRSDFRQVVVSGTAGDDLDYAWEAKFLPGEDLFESGSAVYIYHFVRDALNFKELAIRGSFDEYNETVTDLEKIVIMGEADVCISLLALTLRTYAYLDFLQPMTGEEITAFYVEPSSTAVRDIVISSFSPLLWVTLIATLLLFIFLNNLFQFLTTKLFRFTNFHDDFQKTLVNESFVWVVGIIAQQGWYRTPTSTSLRIVFFLGYFTGLVVYVALSATIASKLSVTLKFINNFEDLLEQKYTIKGDKDAAPYFSILPASLDLGGSSADSHQGTIVEGIDWILNSSTAFLSYIDVYYSKALEVYNLQALSCNVVGRVPATISSVFFTMLIKKKSPLTESINSKVILMLERGLGKRYDVTYNGGFEADCTPGKEEQRPLSVTDLFTPYMIIVCGLALSAIFLCLERFYYIRKSLIPGLDGQDEAEDTKMLQKKPLGDDEEETCSYIFKVLGVKDPKTLWQLHKLD